MATRLAQADQVGAPGAVRPGLYATTTVTVSASTPAVRHATRTARQKACLDSGPACPQDCAASGYDMEPCEDEANAVYDCLDGAGCDPNACSTDIDD